MQFHLANLPSRTAARRGPSSTPSWREQPTARTPCRRGPASTSASWESRMLKRARKPRRRRAWTTEMIAAWRCSKVPTTFFPRSRTSNSSVGHHVVDVQRLHGAQRLPPGVPQPADLRRAGRDRTSQHQAREGDKDSLSAVLAGLVADTLDVTLQITRPAPSTRSTSITA